MTREEAVAFVEEHLQNAYIAVAAMYEQERSREAEIRNKAQDACSAYFVDIREKIKRIRNQITALNGRTAEIETEKEAQHKAFMNAAASGDSEAAAKTQMRLIELEAEQMAIPGQIKALYELPIPGDQKLYEAALDAEADWVDDCTEGVSDGIHDAVKSIFDAISVTFQLGDHKPQVTAWGVLDNVVQAKASLRADIRKMKDNYSGQEPSSVDDDDRRSGRRIL